MAKKKETHREGKPMNNEELSKEAITELINKGKKLGCSPTMR
ncbi:hypothetical protein OEI98_001951 [Thermoanaerobacter sp. RKWS2]|nr:hypothetical protein OEI98_001951 [Thermoanaerobacter sp. RKWS2]